MINQKITATILALSTVLLPITPVLAKTKPLTPAQTVDASLQRLNKVKTMTLNAAITGEESPAWGKLTAAAPPSGFATFFTKTTDAPAATKRTAQLVGFLDQNDASSTLSDWTLTAPGDVTNDYQEREISVKTKSSIIYLRSPELFKILGLSAFSTTTDWIKLDIPLISKELGISNLINQLSTPASKTKTTKPVKKKTTADSFYVTKLKDAKIGDKIMTRLKLTAKPAAVKDYLGATKAKQYNGSVAAELWIGKTDLLPYKFTFTSVQSEKKNSKAYQKTTVNGNFSSYNEPTSIFMPDKYITIEEILAQMFKSLQSAFASSTAATTSAQ